MINNIAVSMILLCSVFTSFFMSSIDSVSNHINFPKTIDTGTTNFTTPIATSLMLIAINTANVNTVLS